MKNFVNNGKTIEITLAANIASGVALLIGTLLGVSVTSGVIGDVVVFNVEGVYTLPKDASVITLGAALYWDDTAKKVTVTASGNTLIGKAWEAAATGITEVAVKLSV
jgi:predicted RecA/RadA family phage recombinase